MRDLATRLMAHVRGLEIDSAASVDESQASAVSLPGRAARVRIGLWPLVSSDNPATALGVMTALGFLLERWQDVVVYRLFVRAQGDPAAYHWTINESQFDVDDWSVEGLDENVALWGTLNRVGSQWSLDLLLEDDNSDTDTVDELSYEAPSLGALVGLLPQISQDIMTLLKAGSPAPISLSYSAAAWDDQRLATLLSAAFEWEKHLFLSLWGHPHTPDETAAAFASLRAQSAAVGGDMGDWLFANAAARAMKPATQAEASHVSSLVPALITEFQGSAAAAAAATTVLLPLALYRLGQEDEAVSLLEAAVITTPHNPTVRLALASLYQRSQNIPDMIRTLQTAIEDDVTSTPLLMAYADLVINLRQSGLLVNKFVLINAPDRQLERMTEEAVAAYDLVLEAEPSHVQAMQRRVILLLELEDDAMWDGFEQLVETDAAGEYVRAVVDSFQLLDDFAEGLDILQDAVAQHPERVDLRVNYAVALLTDDQGSAALEQLEQAEDMTDDPLVIADIERLLLSAADPTFETHLGEITDLVNSGKTLPLSDLEFLEDAIANAQSFSQGYLLLAKAYQQRDDAGAALETLLDGQKYNPEDPEISEMLARTLWDAKERDLAFDYLNKGLAHNPDYVPLLALTGQYLFDDGQEDEARIFLARAESLNPRNRVFQEVMRAISQQLDDE